MADTHSFEELKLQPYRRWYQFGFRSPAVLWSRLRSGHPWLSPFTEIYFGVQRWRYGWSVRDTWNFEYYLSSVIEGGVHHMRQIAHGHPMELTFEEWLQILKEIEVGMEAGRRIMDDMLVDDASDEAWTEAKEQFDLAMDHLKTYWFNLWD